MKTFLLSLGITALLAVGCKPSHETVASGNGEDQSDVTQKLERMKKETREAVDATKDYAFAQKEDFVAAMRVRLDDLKKEIDDLETKARQSSGAAQSEGEAKIRDLRDKHGELSAKLDAARDATDATWQEVKAGFKDGFDQLKQSFSQAREWLSEKIAPKNP